MLELAPNLLGCTRLSSPFRCCHLSAQQVKMDTRTFYGTRSKPFSALTLQESEDFIQSSNKNCSYTVTVLPPGVGTLDIPSDEGQCDGPEDELFEPAGPLEVAYDSSSESDSSCDDEDNANSGQKSRWRKSTTFSAPLTSSLECS